MAAENRILSWEVLQKKGWQGPGIFPLCKNNIEDIDHLFVHCSFTQTVWDKISILLKLKKRWTGTSFNVCFDSWAKDKNVSNNLAVLLCWYIWLERNQVIFEEKAPSVWAVTCKTLRAHNSCSHSKKSAL
jgi:hypothetical protein